MANRSATILLSLRNHRRTRGLCSTGRQGRRSRTDRGRGGMSGARRSVARKLAEAGQGMERLQGSLRKAARVLDEYFVFEAEDLRNDEVRRAVELLVSRHFTPNGIRNRIRLGLSMGYLPAKGSERRFGITFSDSEALQAMWLHKTEEYDMGYSRVRARTGEEPFRHRISLIGAHHLLTESGVEARSYNGARFSVFVSAKLEPQRISYKVGGQWHRAHHPWLITESHERVPLRLETSQAGVLINFDIERLSRLQSKAKMNW